MLEGRATPFAQLPGAPWSASYGPGADPPSAEPTATSARAAPSYVWQSGPPAGQRLPAGGTDPAIFVRTSTNLIGTRPDGEPRVLLALRHPRVREVLADLLAEVGRMTVVAEVGTVAGAFEAVGRARPHVVILDDALDDIADGRWSKMSAFKVVPTIAARWPSTLVVLLSDYGNSSWELQAARQAGAAAVVDKTDRVDRLISVIEQVWASRAPSPGWRAE
jgi:CheY-like chemotaxis protein